MLNPSLRHKIGHSRKEKQTIGWKKITAHLMAWSHNSWFRQGWCDWNTTWCTILEKKHTPSSYHVPHALKHKCGTSSIICSNNINMLSWYMKQKVLHLLLLLQSFNQFLQSFNHIYNLFTAFYNLALSPHQMVAWWTGIGFRSADHSRNNVLYRCNMYYISELFFLMIDWI